MNKYWYKTYIDFCGCCGKEDQWKERVHTEKPANPKKRIKVHSGACYSCKYSLYMV